jgi:transposase-like protein
MPKPYPVEFRRDVVVVARKREAPLTQIAKDFGISEGCLYNWLARADLEGGLTQKDTLELRDAKKRIRLP